MKKLRNQRGSITPSFVILVMLMMLCGSYFLCLMKVYENRLIVRDAVDAAVTSALSGGAELRVKDTLYYEEEVCVAWETDPDTGDRSCTRTEWQDRQGSPANYIYLDPAQAEATALKYLKKNLDNNLDGYTIKKFTFNYAYDRGRDIAVRSVRYNTGHSPYSWWFSELGDSNPPILTAVSERTVRFPRWAKVMVTAEVEIPIPLGRLIGNDTMEFTWSADAVKEVKNVSD